MDGVLVDSAEPHFTSWRILATERGASVTREQFGATFGRQNRDIVPLLFGSLSEAESRVLADRKEAIYRDLIAADPPTMPGAIELLAELDHAGAALAVGSSGPRANIDLILAALGAANRIRVIVSADDVTRGKPDPQVFTLAVQRLGLPAARCVVVEDAPVGIQAARAAGTRTVALLTSQPHAAYEQLGPAAPPDLIVRRLTDLSVARILDLLK